MAGELKHIDVGNELSKTEWEAVPSHTLNSGATGDIIYMASSGLLTRLPIGSASKILTVSSGLPVWSEPLVGDHGELLGLTDEDHPAAAFLFHNPAGFAT